MTSAVLIIPASQRDHANLLGLALNHGPENYTVPLAFIEDPETITHYGARADVTQGFIDTVAAGKAGNLPDIDWSAVGLTTAEAQAVVDNLITDYREGVVPLTHWNEVLEAQGLVRVG